MAPPAAKRPELVAVRPKGMTQKDLEWQTRRFLELETHREGITVFVRTEVVAEIALDGVQASTRYPGGVSLRFARLKRVPRGQIARRSRHHRIRPSPLAPARCPRRGGPRVAWYTRVSLAPRWLTL